MTEEEWRQWQPPTVHGWDQFQHFNDAARRAMAQVTAMWSGIFGDDGHRCTTMSTT